MRQTAFLAIFLTTATLLPAADPALLNMIMPDAKVLAGVNVTKAETSSFGQFLLRNISADQGFEQFVTTSGFDPRTDLQEILVASTTTSNMGLVLARGRFNAAKITAAAQAAGQFTVSNYAGAQLLTPAGGKGQTMAIVTGSSPATLALIGDLANVKAALDRRNAVNPVNPVLASKVALYGTADAWSVSIVPLSTVAGAAKGNPMGGMMQADLLKKVQSTSGGITFSSPIQITGEAEASNPQDATALGDVIKFIGSMVQSSAKDQDSALMSTVAKSLDVTTDRNTVKIALSIPEGALESLIGSGTRKSGII